MNKYNLDYFENGIIKGVSGYMNYRWMPELTIRMAFYLINELKINANETVLDFGCAKGFLVKALRILDIKACGVDISDYAIEHVDSDVRHFCKKIQGVEDNYLYSEKYDWLIAKDVFEHLEFKELDFILKNSKENFKNMFIAVPLAFHDDDGKYIISEYDKDVTHIIRKSFSWWENKFKEHGWIIKTSSKLFKGIKENWTKDFPEGNGFFVITR
jgi:cyclopropane fatty-acyl-phospholipid synthase-like methyltransferase